MHNIKYRIQVRKSTYSNDFVSSLKTKETALLYRVFLTQIHNIWLNNVFRVLNEREFALHGNKSRERKASVF